LVAWLAKLGQLLKPDEHRSLRKRSRYVPRIYVVDEPPTTVEVGGKKYECKSLLQSPTGLLCVQLDGTVAILPQLWGTQNQTQQEQKRQVQLV
jgi:hypothetical protein